MNERPVSVEIPDELYWKSQIPCQAACPVGTDARGYVQAIADGDYERAYLIARGPNPLASMCGRICGAPCEANCRRGKIDAPVAIRALKRFAHERYTQARAEDSPTAFLERLLAKRSERICMGREDLGAYVRWIGDNESSGVFQAPPDGKRVAVIGSGPAGLAASHDLALMGFRVTAYEVEDRPAGMLYTGVPEYRLPRDVIAAEVELIRALGVEFHCNVEVGKDIAFEDIRRDFDAVVISVGLKRSRRLPIPGADGQGVHGAVEFLREIALHREMPLGESVVVVGGGNVAYDAARTVVRQASLDASRSALRLPDVSKVTLCSLESLDEMPADDVEILEGDEEGVVRLNQVGPQEILLDDDGKVRGVRFHRVLSVFDENGRFSPVFDESDEIVVEASSVILAVGQRADLSFLENASNQATVERDERGNLKLDGTTQATTAEGIFAAGEIAYGPNLMIQAVANGKKVAREVYHYLTGQEIAPAEVNLHFELDGYERDRGYEKQARMSVPTCSASERKSSQVREVEQTYDEEAARCEASRCLDCGVNTIFDGTVCILCGGCVDVCPEQCLDIVSLTRLEPSDELDELIELSLGDHSPTRASAIVKNEERCIRCGLCAERCPTGAITMERFSFNTQWTHEGEPALG